MQPGDHATVLEILMATPRRIAAASKGLSEEQLRRNPAPGSWSAAELVAHLRACADVWGKSISTILTEDRPTFRYLWPRTWIRKTNYTDLSFAESFRAYRDQRKDLLKILQNLTQEDWSRGAIVKASDKLREETVLSYAQRMAQHESGHCEQFDSIVAVVAPKTKA